MTIVFIGDVHQRWDLIERGLAALPVPPAAAVLLGDMQCDQPLQHVAAPLLARGVPLWWIFGNHDADGGPEMWANLTDPAASPATAAGALHGRVVTIGGLRVAGLGGTFRPRIWEPPDPPRLRTRADLRADLADLGPHWRAEHLDGLALSLGQLAIWPEDVDALASQRADILVTHEAPGSHPAGKPVLDELARAMGARLIVHGHHHVTYRAVAADGLRALGVAAAAGVGHDGVEWWPGEPPRHLGRMRHGWSLED